MPGLRLEKEEEKDPVSAMRYNHGQGRDPQRGPMAWSLEASHAFSTGVPWLPYAQVGKEHTVEGELSDEHSLLALYRRLVKLHHERKEGLVIPVCDGGNYPTVIRAFLEKYSLPGERENNLASIRLGTILQNLNEKGSYNVTITMLRLLAAERRRTTSNRCSRICLPWERL